MVTHGQAAGDRLGLLQAGEALLGRPIRVLGLHVAAQVDLSLEGAAARVAGEGLEAGVLAAVRDEVGGLGERLAALPTHVRLLA